ncbi:40S ribosomal protein S5-1 [Hordeum vulgare]|nr:40S ribosomal protein S5-1 [Hordeum vulgare]
MTSSSTSKDKFYENVINPYLPEVMKHPEEVVTREGVLHIRYVQGPKRTGSMEERLEEVEQEIFKCKEMVEHGLNANHSMITAFTRDNGWVANLWGTSSSSLTSASTIFKIKSMTSSTKTMSMNKNSKVRVWLHVSWL